MEPEDEKVIESVIETEDSDTSTEETTVTEIGTEEDPSKNPGVRKRINRITAEKYQQKRRADTLQEELNQLKSSEGKAPTLEDPDIDYNDDKYLDARIAYEVDKVTTRNTIRQNEEKINIDRDKTAQEFLRKIEKSDIEGYGETINTLDASVTFSREVLDTITEDEKGPELAYYLGKNLDKASDIAGMTPLRAARALGKLSANLSMKKSKTPSNAPDPIKPVGKGGGAGKKDYEKMSMDEIYASD